MSQAEHERDLVEEVIDNYMLRTDSCDGCCHYKGVDCDHCSHCDIDGCYADRDTTHD